MLFNLSCQFAIKSLARIVPVLRMEKCSRVQELLDEDMSLQTIRIPIETQEVHVYAPYFLVVRSRADQEIRHVLLVSWHTQEGARAAKRQQAGAVKGAGTRLRAFHNKLEAFLASFEVCQFF